MTHAVHSVSLRCTPWRVVHFDQPIQSTKSTTFNESPRDCLSCQIADFGFAGLTQNGGMCYSSVGSEVYMAPEVINPRRDEYAYLQGYDGTKVGAHGGDAWRLLKKSTSNSFCARPAKITSLHCLMLTTCGESFHRSPFCL